MPQIGPYQALVRIVTCGFCNGTDTRIIFEQMTRQQGLQPYPTLLGHEAAGVVEVLGEKVRHIHIGEKHIHITGVAVPPYSSTHAQMAQYGVLTDTQAMFEDGLIEQSAVHPLAKLPADFDLTDAGVLLPLCECLSAVRNFGIDDTTDVLIYGAGPMGLAMMRYMHILGAKSVTAIDSVPERLEMALRIGRVNRVINYETEAVDDVLAGQLFDRVVDAAGLSSIIYEGSRRCKPYGMVCALGVLRAEDSVVDLSLLKNNSRLHMLNFPYQEYNVLDENIGYIQQGLIDPKDFYSHVMPMEDVEQALQLVLSKQTIKVILKMHE